MPAKPVRSGEAGSASPSRAGEQEGCLWLPAATAEDAQTPRKQPRRREHPHTRFNPGPEVAGGRSEQGDAGGLPETPGQVAGLLDHELRGDDAQVHGQQLVALHHLCLVVLAVVAQQLPGEKKTGGLTDTAQTGTLFLTTFLLESSWQGHSAHPLAGPWQQAGDMGWCNPGDTTALVPPCSDIPARTASLTGTLVPNRRAGGCSPVVVSCQHPNGSRIIRENWHLHHFQLVALGRDDSRGQEQGRDS